MGMDVIFHLDVLRPALPEEFASEAQSDARTRKQLSPPIAPAGTSAYDVVNQDARRTWHAMRSSVRLTLTGRLHPVLRGYGSPTRGRRRWHIDAVSGAAETPGERRVDGRLEDTEVDRLGEEDVPQRGFLYWRQFSGCHHYLNLRKCGVELQSLVQFLRPWL